MKYLFLLSFILVSCGVNTTEETPIPVEDTINVIDTTLVKDTTIVVDTTKI